MENAAGCQEWWPPRGWDICFHAFPIVPVLSLCSEQPKAWPMVGPQEQFNQTVGHAGRLSPRLDAQGRELYKNESGPPTSSEGLQDPELGGVPICCRVPASQDAGPAGLRRVPACAPTLPLSCSCCHSGCHLAGRHVGPHWAACRGSAPGCGFSLGLPRGPHSLCLCGCPAAAPSRRRMRRSPRSPPRTWAAFPGRRP